MKTDDLKKRFRELMQVNPPTTEIEQLFEKSIKSGAFDFENENCDDFRLAKIIYHAILCTMAEHWRPYTKENSEESENLKKFL